MNKNRLLIAGAAVALIVGCSGAIAQQERGGRVGPTGAIHETDRAAAAAVRPSMKEVQETCRPFPCILGRDRASLCKFHL